MSCPQHFFYINANILHINTANYIFIYTDKRKVINNVLSKITTKEQVEK